MATAKEIKEHLKIALKEIGNIEPWFDKEVNAWVFSHPLYPVEYAGESAKEVIKNYPFYLKDFIEERLNHNLSANVEKKTKGKAGREKREATKQVALPRDIAEWINKPRSIISVRRLIARTKR